MQATLSEWLVLAAGHGTGPSLAFVVSLAVAGLGSAVVLGLALAALVRRRSRSYLLVTLALATLLARTAIAVLSLAGPVPDGSHHLLEHGLDAVMSALVIAAVYDARRVRRTADSEGPTVRSDGGREPGDDDGERLSDESAVDAREGER